MAERFLSQEAGRAQKSAPSLEAAAAFCAAFDPEVPPLGSEGQESFPLGDLPEDGRPGAFGDSGGQAPPETPPAEQVGFRVELPKPEAVSFERCLELVLALGKAHPNPAEGCRFDPNLAAVLWKALSGAWARTPCGGLEMQVAHLAGQLNLSYKQVRARLELLAAYGILKATNHRAKGRGFVHMGTFYYNPLALELVVRRGGRKLSKAAMEPFFAMGLSRDPSVSRPQGWQGYDVEYGQPEPTPGTPEAVGLRLGPWARAMKDELDSIEEIAAATSAAQASRGLRQKERERRNQLAEAFISGLATVWQQAHARRGLGAARPAWEGPFDQLSPAQKSEYRNLKSIFEKYGGFQTAMAWACFCNYAPDVDKKGNNLFIPSKPHVQWVSSDKKPKHFAGHFDALCMDPLVLARLADKEACARIEAIIGPTFKQEPAPPLMAAAMKHKGAKT